jgi:uncharacterized LabA/DUF88 family protein
MRYRPPQPINYLFIDGAYFEKAVSAIAEKAFGVISVPPLNYASTFSGAKKTFFYDCLPHRKQGEAEAEFQKRVQCKQDLFRRIRSIEGVHVYEGEVRGERNPRQKMIDVMMAVDMLTHLQRGNADTMTLIAGDLDFKPIVDALVQGGMHVVLRYEKRSVSRELADAADARRPITSSELWGWLPREFQASHPNVRAWSDPNPYPCDAWKTIKTGVLSDGRVIRLAQSPAPGQEFCASFEQPENPGYITRVVHCSVTFIEAWVEDYSGAIEWK